MLRNEPRTHVDEMRDIWENALVKSKHKGEESPRGSLIGIPASKPLQKAKSKPLDRAAS